MSGLSLEDCDYLTITQFRLTLLSEKGYITLKNLWLTMILLGINNEYRSKYSI